jgi:hypothetical protein
MAMDKKLTNIHINDCKTVGRMGNQLFIMASIIGIAKKLGYSYAFPRWQNNTHINIPLFNDTIDDTCTEKKHGYDAGLIQQIIHSQGHNIQINGYLQDYRYFDEYRSLIQSLFNKTPSTYNNLCAIHIRRGDYVNLSNHYVQLSQTSYYDNAIETILDINNDTQFMIYSDDINWCINWFNNHKYFNKMCFVTPTNAYNDMIKMSKCQYQIIANSTYSWWAAYLNQASNKRVIMPKQWFGPMLRHLNIDGYAPNDWIKI